MQASQILKSAYLSLVDCGEEITAQAVWDRAFSLLQSLDEESECEEGCGVEPERLEAMLDYYEARALADGRPLADRLAEISDAINVEV